MKNHHNELFFTAAAAVAATLVTGCGGQETTHQPRYQLEEGIACVYTDFMPGEFLPTRFDGIFISNELFRSLSEGQLKQIVAAYEFMQNFPEKSALGTNYPIYLDSFRYGLSAINPTHRAIQCTSDGFAAVIWLDPALDEENIGPAIVSELTGLPMASPRSYLVWDKDVDSYVWNASKGDYDVVRYKNQGSIVRHSNFTFRLQAPNGSIRVFPVLESIRSHAAALAFRATRGEDIDAIIESGGNSNRALTILKGNLSRIGIAIDYTTLINLLVSSSDIYNFAEKLLGNHPNIKMEEVLGTLLAGSIASDSLHE